jgi:CubicO group peptidase (beta-lactamase class C family)
MGVMRLVQDGKLKPDTNVNNQLRSWKIHDNQFTSSKPVALRELLSHSAMTSIHGFPGYDLHAPLPTLEQILDGAAPANKFRGHGGGHAGQRLEILGQGYGEHTATCCGHDRRVVFRLLCIRPF